MLLLLLVNSVSGIKLELIYISLILSILSSLTHLRSFQLLVLLSHVVGVTFFRLYQQHKSSESKVEFRQVSSCCRRVFEAAKLSYANKTKESSLPRNLALRTFGELLIVFSTKVNLVYLLCSTILLYLSSASEKAKLFTKCFSRTPILITQVSLYL